VLTDRDVRIALFHAIGALAKRLTGESLVVECRDEAGNVYRANTDDGCGTWIDTRNWEVLVRPEDPSERAPTCS